MKTEKNTIVGPIVEGEEHISKDDLFILKLIKDHASTILECKRNTMGLHKWYDKFYESDEYYSEYTPEQRLQSAIIFNKLDYLLSKLVYDTKLTKRFEFREFIF